MKNLKFLFAALLGALVLCSCDRLSNRLDNYDVGNDSIKIAEAIQSVTNPQFITLNDVIEFRESHNEMLAIDSAFFSLPEPVLQNVVIVLLKKNKTSITKKDIVEEFRLHKDVYANIPPTSTPVASNTTDSASKDVDRTSTDLGNKRPSKVSINFRTDTIDGKPVKVMIKTEEIYE